MELRELLDLKNIDISKTEQRFEEIAKLLFQKYYIKKGNDSYEFLEIEFYYYAKNHEDIITYPRNVREGKWFFHNSGVDISFESMCEKVNQSPRIRKPNEDYFGGILVRSLLKNGTELITGPQRCAWSLFDFFDAFEMNEQDLPLIKKSDRIKDSSVISTKRHIHEDKAQQRFGDNYSVFNKYNEKLYRFYIKHSQWDGIKKSNYSARPW